MKKRYKDPALQRTYEGYGHSNSWTRPIYWAGIDLAQYDKEKGLV
jgi:hypothetical protein